MKTLFVSSTVSVSAGARFLLYRVRGGEAMPRYDGTPTRAERKAAWVEGKAVADLMTERAQTDVVMQERGLILSVSDRAADTWKNSTSIVSSTGMVRIRCIGEDHAARAATIVARYRQIEGLRRMADPPRITEPLGIVKVF